MPKVISLRKDLFARAMTATRQQRVWPEKQVEGNESVICVLGDDFNMDMDQVKAGMRSKYSLDQHGPDIWQVAESDTRDKFLDSDDKLLHGAVPQLKDWVRVWRWAIEGTSLAFAERFSVTDNWLDQ